MKLRELLLESKNLSKIQDLDKLIKTSKKPVFVLLAGSSGSGKSYVVKRDLAIDTIDTDKFVMELGSGAYDGKNVAKAMHMMRKATAERLSNKQTFAHQGTSANLHTTINKLKEAKKSGFTTVLLYVDAPIEQAIRQIEKRVADGGHGETITRKKVEKNSAGARLTFGALSGVDFKPSEEDMKRVEQALDKSAETTLETVRRYLDYFIRVENKY